MDSILTTLEYVLGLSGDALAWWQLGLRALLLYTAGLVLVRLGKRRFMGTYTAFDMILGITVGALLANAASDSELFINAIAIVFILAGLHWILSFITYRWDWVEVFLIGKKRVIIKDSELQLEGMRSTRISKSDIGQAMRKAGLEDIGEVKHAFLERNGELSVVPFEDETQNEGRKNDDRPADESESADQSEHGEAPDDADAGVDEKTAGSGSSGRAASNEAPGTSSPRRPADIVEIDVQEGVQRVVVELRS